MADFGTNVDVHATVNKTSNFAENLIVTSLVVAAMYFGRALFVPLALAIFLTFLLAPAVDLVRRFYVPKSIAVFLTTVSAFGLIVVIAFSLGQQVTRFAEDLPRYQYTLTGKLQSLRDMAQTSGQFGRAAETLEKLRNVVTGSDAKQVPGPTAPPSPNASTEAAPEAKPVRVALDDTKTPMERLVQTLEVAVEPLATAGIVIIFVLILLLERQDVRDRAIKLLGVNDLERTTRAMDDAGSRLKRYFLAASAINTIFGTVIGAGLWLIGIPNPLLWGVIAGFMRFVPFVGIFLSAALPILIAFSIDPGWNMLIWTAVLFIISEVLVSQVVETIVHGQATGLSPLAIIIATAFWTLLWGPIGLVLAVPLTVVIVVIGRHIERFRFLDILLGSQPALSPADSFYQRILAGDPEEAAEQATMHLKDASLLDYYSSVVMQALGKAAYDVHTGNLEGERLRDVATSIDSFVEYIDESLPADQLERSQAALEGGTCCPVLCVSARTPVDEAAASLLAQLLNQRGVQASAADNNAAQTRDLPGVDPDVVKVIVISSFVLGQRPAQSKFLIKRLRRRFPQAKVVVAFWRTEVLSQTQNDVSFTVDADDVVSTLSQAIDTCVETIAPSQPDAPRPVVKVISSAAA